jgi:hypothetical protein
MLLLLLLLCGIVGYKAWLAYSSNIDYFQQLWKSSLVCISNIIALPEASFGFVLASLP